MAKDQNKPKAPPPSPPPQPRTGAGARAAERREERERERRRRQYTIWGVIAVIVIVVIAGVVYIVRAPADAPIPDGALTRYHDISTSRTKDGFPRLGDPVAPVQVAEYLSFDNADSRTFNDATIDQFADRVRGGKMALTFVPLYSYGDVANGQGAAAASICAAEQAQFWPFHDALFSWAGQYGNQAFTNNRINAGVAAFKLDGGAFSGCISSGRAMDVLATAKTQSKALPNFTTPPIVTIDGVVVLGDDQKPLTDPNAIMAKVDEAIQRASLAPTPQVTAEATGEATAAATSTAEATSAAIIASTPESTSTAEATVASTAAR
ncbi:MAG TPA: thioredoxin domain-containing protein [Phototrophicaceae bacterium]|nr:thioredoxin domain-containing protein [Phototrophicaceae bacterium]